MYAYSAGQYLFDRTLAGLIIAFKFACQLFLYSPLWFSGYIISTKILDKEASAFSWLGLILFFSILLYQLMFFIKGLIIGFRESGKLIWLPLAIILLFFTCFLPVYLFFPHIYALMVDVYAPQAKTLSWFAGVALFFAVYSRYHFFTDMAPFVAYPSYQAGLSLSSSLIGEKSKRIF